VRDACGQPKLAANWLMGEVSKRLNASGASIEQSPVTPAQLARLIARVVDGTVSNNGARQVFDMLWATARYEPEERTPELVDYIIDKEGLRQMNDTGALAAIVDQVIAANPKSVEEFRAGKDKAFNALVGQVMKASQGKANPAQAGALLKDRLGAA
jgi:aspartyl-tRNA(Asn)/glutamyl-tRNA(Gln) amidotransferase subunit B